MDSKSYLKLLTYLEAADKEAYDLGFEMKAVIKHGHDNEEDSCANAIKVKIAAERIAKSLKDALEELNKLSINTLNSTNNNKKQK